MNPLDRARSEKPVDPFYRSAAWKGTRARALAIYGRVCCVCRVPIPKPGRAHIDHKVSRQVAPHLAFEVSNLQVLCTSCHSRKTATHNRGFGNKERPQGGGADWSGEPTDAAHPWNRPAGLR